MIVHKLLLGEGAEKHLPFAFARLSALARINPKGTFTQRYEIEGFSITVSQSSAHSRYILIVSEGEAYFEFQTSGYPVVIDNITQAGTTYKAYRMGVVGVTIKKNVLVAVLREGKRGNYASLLSRIERENQVQLLDEPVHYYSAKPVKKASQHYARKLYDSWAANGGHSGIHYRDYHAFFQVITFHTLLGSITSHFIRDVGYDAGWADSVDLQKLRFADLTSNDWPRRSGICKVEDTTLGTREFAVIIDAFDQVSVFPTSAIGPREIVNGAAVQNVPAAMVKTQRVTFPSWVYRKSQSFKSYYTANSSQPAEIATGLYAFPEIDWQFHPDGNKVCAVVYERIAAQFDSTYYAPFATEAGDHSQGPGTFYPNTTSFNLMNAVTMGVTALHRGAQNPGDTFYQSAPGLLEVAITISISGPNAEDFSVSLTTTELRRPTTSPYCGAFVGYSWCDIKTKNFDPNNPKYDSRRGDLCVLDLEAYGNLTTNKAANLWSLKNITQNKEIRTFGANSAFTSGALLSGGSSLLAADFKTLSFAFKLRNEVITFDTYTKRDVQFGVSIYVLNKYQHTFFPTLMSVASQNAILSKVDRDDRAAGVAELGDLSLMPLNDLRDWTNSDLASLREHYVRSLSKSVAQTYGPYTGNPQPFGNPDIAGIGYKYWKTGSYVTPTPSTEAQNWYNNIVRHGLLKPYVLYDLVTPRPGWWQHMGLLAQYTELNPHTTFFTHPNGTWAFFNQSLMYNANGIHVVPLGVSGLGTSEWNPVNMEHCIFDKVHFVVWSKDTSKVIDSTFRELYNQAVTNGTNAGVITDGTKTVSLTNMKAVFASGVVADPYDSSITYAQMRVDWGPSFVGHYHELGYFSGVKNSNFDAGLLGGAVDLSFSALWKNTAAYASDLVYPDQVNMPVTFSTCVLITKQ